MTEAIVPWHVVASRDDLAALAAVEQLEGSLVVRAGAGARCQLPRLRTVTGHVVLEDCGDVAELQLPALATVGWQLAVFGSGLQTLSLPALVSIGACLELDGNLALVDVALPALRRVGASLIVDDNPRLAALSLPALAEVAITATCAGCPVLPEHAWQRVLRAVRR